MKFGARRAWRMVLTGAMLIWTVAIASDQGLFIPESLSDVHEKKGGSWSVEKGLFSQNVADKGSSLMLWGEPDWNDYSFRAKVRIENADIDSEAGLVLHAGESCYLVCSLVRRKGGACVVARIQLESGKTIVGDQYRADNLNLSNWHEIKADVHGSEMICFLDGKPVAGYWFSGTPPPYNSHGQTWPVDPEQGRPGLITTNCAAQFKDFGIQELKDFSHIVTPQRGKRDRDGFLLPQQSYAETMKRFTEWMINSAQFVDVSPAPKPFRHLEPALQSNFVDAGDKLWTPGGEYAFNHAVLISNAVQYYIFSGDSHVLDYAERIADWHLANLTPPDSVYPNLAPSVVAPRDDGTWVGQDWGLEPDKSAYMADSLLKLYAATGEKKYFRAAEEIAGTLRKLQGKDGNWPFRINPKTGEIKEGYTCSQLWYVWFFRHLAAFTDNKEDVERSKKAFQWLMKGPIKDNKWIGLYGDVVSGAESYDQWVALETAMELLDRRNEFTGAVRLAKNILEYVEETLLVDYGLHPAVPGVVEQSGYGVVLTHHQLRLAETYAKLFEATGNAVYKRKAIEAANSVTWCLMSDGKMRLGFWDHASCCLLVLCYNTQFSRIMSCIPETAPCGETHILQNTADITTIFYQPKEVAYETLRRGEEILIVQSRPKAVLAEETPLREIPDWRFGETGWWYDSTTGLLKVRHQGCKIAIRF